MHKERRPSCISFHIIGKRAESGAGRGTSVDRRPVR